MPRWIPIAAAAAVLVLSGLALGLRLGGPVEAADDARRAAASRGAAEIDGLRTRIEALERALDEAAAERDRLARRVVSLGSPTLQRDAESGEAAPSAAVPGEAALQDGDGLDEGILLEAGFDPARIEAFREELDALELERLFLRDRAEREGWLASPRFLEESRALDAARRDLESQGGEEFRDWLLYAQGSPNRVQVSDVMSDSPAERAGVEAGDLLVRYDGRPIHTFLDLRESTRSGEPDERIALEIERDGGRIRLSVPRGPLGVRLRPLRRAPGAAG